MADASLQAESVCANPTIRSLYAAFMCAKAEWDLATYSPEYLERDLPRDLEAKFCNAHSEALNKMLLHPSADAGDLALKLSVYRDEDLADGWHKASEIIVVLAEDAHRIAHNRPYLPINLHSKAA